MPTPTGVEFNTEGQAATGCSDRSCQFGSLLDRTLGVQFHREVRAADDVNRFAARLETTVQFAPRNLPRAKHHVVDIQQARFSSHLDVQSKVVDAAIGDAGQHPDPAVVEAQAMRPAGGFAEALARLSRLALQQPNFAA